MHNLPHVSWAGSYSIYLPQHAIAAGWDLEDLSVDDLSVDDPSVDDLPYVWKVGRGQNRLCS